MRATFAIVGAQRGVMSSARLGLSLLLMLAGWSVWGPTGGGSNNGVGPGDASTVPAPPPSHGNCDAYLKCVASVSPETLPAAMATYGPTGTCWEADAGLADTCVE